MSDFDNVSNSDNFDEFFDGLGYRFEESFSGGWVRLSESIRQMYDKTTDKFEDELVLPVTQDYVNDALQKFVTDNVKAILELRVEMHDDWFRLYSTINTAGIYVEVASNFRLVHVQLDRNVQRLVFGQQTYTDILNLRCESYLKRQGVKFFIWFYHSILKKDPLGFLLSYIKIARAKDEVIYIDINRWLKNNKKIISTLHKVQVNYGELEEEQMILKTQVNYRDLLSAASNEDIISEDDQPESIKDPTDPINETAEAHQA